MDELKPPSFWAWTWFPYIRIEHMIEAQKRAYVIADNKLALNAGWDYELLAEELKEPSSPELDIDLGLTGFTIAEVDNIIPDSAPEEPGNPDDDVLPDVDPQSIRCKPGDIWQVGQHRIICGDARDRNTIATLMDGKLATAVITDPPYNVKTDGHVGGSGKIKHREFAMTSGEMSSSAFTEFLKAAFRNLAEISVDGSIHFIFMDWRHMSKMLTAGHSVYDELKNLLVWDKDNGAMGTFYRSRHELVFAFKKGKNRISTPLNSANTVATGRMSGNTKALTRLNLAALKSFLFIPPSNLSSCWPMPSGTSLVAVVQPPRYVPVI